MRIPGLRRSGIGRAVELVGGTALVVRLAEAIRDWERGGAPKRPGRRGRRDRRPAGPLSRCAPTSDVASDDRPFAVIDIGSNSGRMIVFRLREGEHLDVIEDARAPLRLARDLRDADALGPEAIERTLEALRDFLAVAEGAGATRMIAVATAAVRDAADGGELVERARNLGVPLQVIDGDHEARLGFVGAVHDLPVTSGLTMDVGGGSVELTRFRDRRLERSWSMQLGSLRVSDRFLESDPPTEIELRSLRRFVSAALNDAGITELEAQRGPGRDRRHRPQPREGGPEARRLPAPAAARLLPEGAAPRRPDRRAGRTLDEAACADAGAQPRPRRHDRGRGLGGAGRDAPRGRAEARRVQSGPTRRPRTGVRGRRHPLTVLGAHHLGGDARRAVRDVEPGPRRSARRDSPPACTRHSIHRRPARSPRCSATPPRCSTSDEPSTTTTGSSTPR